VAQAAGIWSYGTKPRAKRPVFPSSIEQREPIDFMSLEDNHLIAARAVCCLSLIKHHQNEDQWEVDNRRKEKSTCISVRFANGQLCAQ